MEKRWTTLALLSTSHTVTLAEDMSFSYLFDREKDHSSLKFTMKWCKWNEHCKTREETPNKERRVIFTNPIKAWGVQRHKCNVNNHLKKTEPRQIVIVPDPPILESQESNK